MISNKATLGAGCYWGTEKFLINDFNKKFPGSIDNGVVGFMGGAKKYPTYREVCSGKTGHVEVYDMEYDGKESTYENMLRFFFSFHDPTTIDRQGNDRGSQYVRIHLQCISNYCQYLLSAFTIYSQSTLFRPLSFSRMMIDRKRLLQR